MTTVTRRDFLAASQRPRSPPRPAQPAAQGAPIPIIDTHIHLFDPTRPQGAPYSGPRAAGAAPIAAYPDRYRKLAMPLGSVGAIKVEASPWVEDNLWVLEVAQRDTIIVGVIGNLEPDKPEFKEYFDRYRKHPLFRGIRYGNLWGRDIAKQAENPVFIDGLKLLADADLVLDTANPRMALLESMLKISDKVPSLRIVLDHLPNFEPTPEERPAYAAALKEFAKRPQIYVKLSAILRRVDGNGVDRRQQLPRQARSARRHVRRRSHPVRERLAEQRRRGAGRSGLHDREGVLRHRSRARSRRNTSGRTRSPPTNG